MNLEPLVRFTEIVSAVAVSIAVLSLIATLFSLKSSKEEDKEQSKPQKESKFTVTHQTTAGDELKLELHYSPKDKNISEDDVKTILSKLIKQLNENKESQTATNMIAASKS